MTSWRYSMGEENTDNEQSSKIITTEVLRRHAEEWLGPERSFDDLEIWEQNRLLAEIEADLVGPENLRPRLQTIIENDTYRSHY